MNKLILAILLSLPMVVHAQVSGPGNTFGFRSQINVPLDLDGDGCKETIEIGDYDGDGSLEIADDIEAGMDALTGSAALTCADAAGKTTAPKHVTLIPGIFKASEANGAWPTPTGDYAGYGLFLTVPSDTLFECPLATGSGSAMTTSGASSTNNGASVRSLTVIRAPAWSDRYDKVTTPEVNGLGVAVTDDRRNYSVVGSAMNGPKEAGNGSKNIIIRGCEFDGNMGTDYEVRSSVLPGDCTTNPALDCYTFPTRMVGRFHECTDCRIERNYFHSSAHTGLYGKYVNGIIADGNRISHYGNYNADRNTGASPDENAKYGQAGFYAYTTKNLGDMNLVIFRNNLVQHGSGGASTRRDTSSGDGGDDAPFPSITNVFYDDNVFEDLEGDCFLLGGISGGHARNTVCSDYTGNRLFENHQPLTSYAMGSYAGDIQTVDNFIVSGMTLYPRAGPGFALSIEDGLSGVVLENIYIDGEYNIGGCVQFIGPSSIKVRNWTLRRCGSEKSAATQAGTFNPGYAESGAQSAVQITEGWDRIHGSACPGTNCGQGILDIDGMDIEGYYTAAFYLGSPISGQVWKNVSITGGKGSNNLTATVGTSTVRGMRITSNTPPMWDMTFENWTLTAVPDPWAYRGEYAGASKPDCQKTLGADKVDRFDNTWIMINDATTANDIVGGGDGSIRNRAYCVEDSANLGTWEWVIFRVNYADAFELTRSEFGTASPASGRFVFKNIMFNWADGMSAGNDNWAIDFSNAGGNTSTLAGTILDGVTIRGQEAGPYQYALESGIQTGSAQAADWSLSGTTGSDPTDGVSSGSHEPICIGLNDASKCIIFHVP